MGTFRPDINFQLPDNSCVINGHALGGESCTACGTATQIDRSTLGGKKPNFCSVRVETGDFSGGLTLRQCTDAAKHWGVTLIPLTGGSATTARHMANVLRAGGSLQLQIGTRPLLGTTFRSTAGAINHDIYINEGRDWGDDGYPAVVLVYDSAADGRKRSYHVDTGPSWWPWSLALRAGGALQPWGEQDSRTMASVAPGRYYAAEGPDTEPHVELRWSAVKTVPFPDHMRAIDPPGTQRVNVRYGPGSSTKNIPPGKVIDLLEPKERFNAYQVTTKGAKVDGSTTWYGNLDGHRWVHVSGLTNIGGV